MALKFPFEIDGAADESGALVGDYLSATSIPKFRAVYLVGTNTVSISSNSSSNGYPNVIGVSRNAVSGPSQDLKVVEQGELVLETNVFTIGDEGKDVFFNSSGQLTLTPPPENPGDFIQRVGFVKAPNKVTIKIAEPFLF